MGVLVVSDSMRECGANSDAEIRRRNVMTTEKQLLRILQRLRCSNCGNQMTLVDPHNETEREAGVKYVSCCCRSIGHDEQLRYGTGH